jgi:hypothetical protein
VEKKRGGVGDEDDRREPAPEVPDEERRAARYHEVRRLGCEYDLDLAGLSELFAQIESWDQEARAALRCAHCGRPRESCPCTPRPAARRRVLSALGSVQKAHSLLSGDATIDELLSEEDLDVFAALDELMYTLNRAAFPYEERGRPANPEWHRRAYEGASELWKRSGRRGTSGAFHNRQSGQERVGRNDFSRFFISLMALWGLTSAQCTTAMGR